MPGITDLCWFPNSDNHIWPLVAACMERNYPLLSRVRTLIENGPAYMPNLQKTNTDRNISGLYLRMYMN